MTHSTNSTNPEEPPYWMLPDFKPQSCTIRDLRGILLENDVRHSLTKKADLVGLVEREVLPKCPDLLEAHRNVKPSCAGIFDMKKGRYLTDKDSSAFSYTGATAGRQTPSAISPIDFAEGEQHNSGEQDDTNRCPFTEHVSPMTKAALRAMIQRLDPTLKIPT
ncbi:hypothetical protein MJO28_002495 [Puccinia striiformis f. sp. tritici]|nr:hypothetical protein MJO28_002495 [Puccinia striiformis f. sp. tritici]